MTNSRMPNGIASIPATCPRSSSQFTRTRAHRRLSTRTTTVRSIDVEPDELVERRRQQSAGSPRGRGAARHRDRTGPTRTSHDRDTSRAASARGRRRHRVAVASPAASGAVATERAASYAADVTTDVAYRLKSNWTAKNRNPTKKRTPNEVLSSPAPRSRSDRRHSAAGADVVDGRARLRSRAGQDLREDHVHRGAEERDDQDGDRRRDDTFAAVVTEPLASGAWPLNGRARSR